MPTVITPEDIERKPLYQFTEQAYLDYAMYVILDRALPHIADGLKPVQRRIIYAMSELGLNAGSKYKKSARTVGDVLGKFHPHGDSACYEAMVLMAQPFSYRYPLVDGQGNWGSLDDPKSFAAMRYTEARLSAFSDILLREMGQGTVDWTANFDGTLEEPLLLPARLPHILLNGTTGIAVGMATDIPPHNLREVVDACIYLLKNSEATVKELCQFIQSPDFPTEAEIITPLADIHKMYESGNGSIRMRACYLREDGDIVITALPHQTSGAKIIAQIAEQMNAKKLPLLEDIRDESDHENPVRLVLVPRSNRVDVDELMAHLFATTDLERSYRINLNMIGLDGRPQVKNLKIILNEWLTFRLQIVRRRLEYQLNRLVKRLHILDGLLIAYLNIAEIIDIIRQEDEPKKILIQRFGLSDTQAEAILELKLRHLARLEEISIRAEQENLSQERDHLTQLLASDIELKNLLRKELKQDAKTYGNNRRSPLIERQAAQALDQTELVTAEPITVILSAKGWVRAAKGYDIEPTHLNYRAGDHFAHAAQGRSTQTAVFLDSTGRSYAALVHTLPSARSQGEPLTGRFTPPAGAEFLYVLLGEPTQKYLLASDAGYGFIVTLEELYVKNKSGKVVVTLPEGAKLLPPLLVTQQAGEKYLAMTNTGYLGIVRTEELPLLTKGKGFKLLNLPTQPETRLLHLKVLHLPTQITLQGNNKRHLTLKGQDVEFYCVEREQRAKKLPKNMYLIENIQIHPETLI